MTQSPVDIIIPTFNQLKFLRQCVKSLWKTTEYPFKLHISDDSSTDSDMRDYLMGLHLSNIAGIFINKPRVGFGANCNQAVAKTKGELFCLLNQDTQATQGWLRFMVEAMESDHKLAAVGAKLIYPAGKEDWAGTIQHIGVAREQGGLPYHPFRGDSPNIPQAVHRRYVNAVTAACVLIRREAWNEAGGFDPEFIWGNFEDVDWCYRARRKGWRILVEPKAILYHYEHGCGEQYVVEGHDQNRALLLDRWGHLDSDEKLFKD